MKYMEVKRVNSYVSGIIGQDIRLSFFQKIRLLFCKGITAALISPEVAQSGEETHE